MYKRQGYGHPLTPEDVERDLEEFRDDFQDAVEDAARVAKIYPKEFANPPKRPAAKKDGEDE